MLFYTEIKRDASEVLESQNDATQDKRSVLGKMCDLVLPLRDVLSGNQDMRRFGEILHEGWLLKKSITNDISNSIKDVESVIHLAAILPPVANINTELADKVNIYGTKNVTKMCHTLYYLI